MFRTKKKKIQTQFDESFQKYKYRMVDSRSPEFADDYIFAAETGNILPPVKLDEKWEAYKESVGYYRRHPEREQESKNCVKQWIKNNQCYQDAVKQNNNGKTHEKK